MLINNTIEDDRLYKHKEILEMYPVLTTYSINKAVKEKKLTYTQIGNARYFKKKDIENYFEENRKEAYKFRGYVK